MIKNKFANLTDVRTGKNSQYEVSTVLNGSLLVALDGVEYFSSEKIHCDCCSTQEFTNGIVATATKRLRPLSFRLSKVT